MVGIEGQYACAVSVGGSDTLSEDQLVSVKLVAGASLPLPRFELFFRTYDDAMLRALEAGATVVAGVGLDAENLSTSVYRPMRLEVSRMTLGECVLKVSGLLDRVDVLKYSGRYASSRKMSGIEAILEACEVNGLDVDAAVEQSEDSQLWVQAGWTLRRFLQHTWLHSRLPGSSPCLGWSHEGRLIIRDLRVQFEESLFDVGPLSEVACLGDYKITDKAGFVETIGGTDQGFAEMQLSGSDLWRTEFEDEAASLLSPSSPSRFWGTGRQTANMDALYWQTYLANVSYLYHASAGSCTWQLKEPKWDMQVLDGFKFFDESGEGADTVTSGQYVLAKLSYLVQNRSFSMVGVGSRLPILGAD